MKSTAKIILSVTVAAAAGAAIGLLLAPEKGSELQKKIRKGAEDLFSNFNSLLSTAKKEVSKEVSQVKSKANHEVEGMKVK